MPATDQREDDFISTLPGTVSLDFLGEELGEDVNAAIRLALRAGGIFPTAGTPLAQFRQAVADAIGRISANDRWDLFQRFLKHGPPDLEEAESRPEQLTQDETASVISFIWNGAINSFQGAIAELLAVGPCTRILQTLQQEGRVTQEARLHVGDAVLAVRSRGSRHAKGADLHLLAVSGTLSDSAAVSVLGVGEVKSYFCRETVFQRQLKKHVARARLGLRVCGTNYLPESVRIGHGPEHEVVKISVMPSRWLLPRDLRWRKEGKVRVPEVVPGSPPSLSDEIVRLSSTEWVVRLRWSKEALASAAYEMTFWLMSKIGEFIYRDGVPTGWSEMSPAEAGYNAAKEKLYYAIRPYAVKAEASREQGNPTLTRKELMEMQRAIALYNSYGFGYMLGMNFRNREGKREMLWPRDLDEILVNRQTKQGCRIV